jgi:hypothetical protein
LNRLLAPALVATLGLTAPALADEPPAADVSSSASSAPASPPASSSSVPGPDEVNVPSSTPPPRRMVMGAGSLLSGRTLQLGDAFLVQFGWPGIEATYLHARSKTVDVGGTFTFNYGREGLLEIDPGVKFQGTVRIRFYDNGKLNLGLRLDPGIAMYFSEPAGEGFAFGACLPAALALGVSVGDALMLHFGFDVPLLVRIVPTDFFRFEIPFLFGAGAEYRVDNHLSVTFDCRFGPDLLAYTDHTETQFAFRALVGIGYRL